MKRLTAFLFAIVIIGLVTAPLLAQNASVTAVANSEVNYRSDANINGALLGQLELGIPYPIVGRSEFTPWLLLGDPTTQQPIGWVFQDIVTVAGPLFTVPFSTQIVTSAPATAQPLASIPTATPLGGNAVTSPVAPPPAITATATTLALATATPNFAIGGTVQNEVNVRYGPGTDYPSLGIAQAGERFEITAWHSQFDWLQIRYGNSPTGFAWIYAPLLFDITGDPYASLQPITQTAFNLPTLTPTPSVIQSGAEADAVPLSPEFAELGDQLFNIMLNAGFNPETRYFGSVYLEDLQTGEALSFGGDIAYSGTSVNKISILVGLYSILNTPPDEALATNIANTMICSENANTNRLISVIGGNDEWEGTRRITNMLQTIGIENSFLLAPYTIGDEPPLPPAPIAVPQTDADQERAFPEPYNQLTVEDAGTLLSSIYQCAYEDSGPLLTNFPSGTFEPRECRQMIHVMASNNVDGLLRAGAPAEARVAHKHGWIDPTHSNAGIFFTPGGDYVLAATIHSNVLDATGNRYLSFEGAPISSLPAFAEVSRTVYNYYNPDNPLPAIRDGFIPDALSCNYAGDPLVADLMLPVWDQ